MPIEWFLGPPHCHCWEIPLTANPELKQHIDHVSYLGEAEHFHPFVHHNRACVDPKRGQPWIRLVPFERCGTEKLGDSFALKLNLFGIGHARW